MQPQATTQTLGKRPSRVLVFGVGLAALFGTFLFGQSSASQDPIVQSELIDAPSADAFVPVPLTIPTTLKQPELETLLGDVVVLSDTTFANGSRGLVVCNVSGWSTDFVLVETENDLPVIVERSEIGPTASAACEPCPITVSETLVSGDRVVYGGCSNGGTSLGGTVFVLGSLPSPATSAFVLVLACGMSQFEEQDGELVLRSYTPRSPNYPTYSYPDIHFTPDQKGRFGPVDEELVTHFCEVIHSNGPVLSSSDQHGNRVLSHDLVESEIGVIGVHDAVLVGLDQPTCTVLIKAMREASFTGSSADGFVAELVGLEPPPGLDDWYVTCLTDLLRNEFP